MTNREKLEQAGLVTPDTEWNQEQSDAVESLTPDEVDSLSSMRDKLGDAFGGRDQIFLPVQTHALEDDEDEDDDDDDE